eukprot:TRINITY_DN62846_c0_g1_i1.p1 TRINITY_DN62846_c0_g1~~TRINITY_DN62846_c0_g1_i1.p1  ORF type:complete len:381 (+),score=40.63 TRINITY_DN62846_c0_g1_i1:52-1194(+)
MRFFRLAILYCACRVESSFSEIRSDSSLCGEDGDIVFLQTNLKVSFPSAHNSLEARMPTTGDEVESHRDRMRWQQAYPQVASSTGQLATDGRSHPNMRFVVLLIVAIMILVPVVVVCIIEVRRSRQTTSANSGSSKQESALPPERNLQTKRSVRIQESDADAGELPPTAQPAHINPPAICPSLVLPMHEARFMISLGRIRACMQGQLGPIDILGLSGHKLLHGMLEDARESGTRLTIASVNRENDPRAIIVTGKSVFRHEVHGPDGQTYGTLDFFGARVLLMQSITPVMVFDAGDPNALQYIASGMDGRVLATAGRHANELSEEDEVWRLQVRPGIDSILTMICMLAIILLPRQRVRGAAAPSMPGVSSGSWRSPYSSWQ